MMCFGDMSRLIGAHALQRGLWTRQEPARDKAGLAELEHFDLGAAGKCQGVRNDRR